MNKINLLKELKTNELDLRNRVVMAPLTRTRAHNKDLAPSDLIAEYYEQRASAGLIISEGTPVNPNATGYIDVPGIYSEKQLEGWKKVTSGVHAKGGKMFAQLWHVGRISHPDLVESDLPLAPSAINANFQSYTRDGFVDTVTPKAMTEEDLEDTIFSFQKAAVNAIENGFDGVEIHAANGYLFHQFFAKCSNVREDKYGGSIENRARFLFDVLDRINEKVSIEKVGVRLAPDMVNTFGIVKDDETDLLFEYIVKKLNEYNLAYLHISGFSLDPNKKEENIIKTAKHYRKLYNGTYMINGGFTKDTANRAIEEGYADLVSFGVPFIANPDLVERFATNSALNEADKNTFYGIGPVGYTDYPTL